MQFQSARTLRSLVFLGAALSMGLQANVFDVHSTGSNATGVDPNYTVIVSPGAGCQDSGVGCSPTNIDTTPLPTVVDDPGVFPFGYWAPSDPATSQWISVFPGNTQAGGVTYTEPAGVYVYQTSFYLPADTTSLSLSGIWDTDNEGFGVLLNPGAGDLAPYLASSPGAPVPGPFNITTNGDQPFLSFPPANGAGTFSFTGSSGFNTGATVNYLDFVVWNEPQSGGNPEGLRVQFTDATATVTDGQTVTTVTSSSLAPEPGFYGVLAVGLAGLAFAVRRRRTSGLAIQSTGTTVR